MKRTLDALSPDKQLPHELLYCIGKWLYRRMDETSERGDWAVFVSFALTSAQMEKAMRSRLKGLREDLEWCAICIVRPGVYARNCLAFECEKGRNGDECDRLCDSCAVQVCHHCGGGHCGCASDYNKRCVQCRVVFCDDCADYKGYFIDRNLCPACYYREADAVG